MELTKSGPGSSKATQEVIKSGWKSSRVENEVYFSVSVPASESILHIFLENRAWWQAKRCYEWTTRSVGSKWTILPVYQQQSPIRGHWPSLRSQFQFENFHRDAGLLGPVGHREVVSKVALESYPSSSLTFYRPSRATRSRFPQLHLDRVLRSVPFELHFTVPNFFEKV